MSHARGNGRNLKEKKKMKAAQRQEETVRRNLKSVK